MEKELLHTAQLIEFIPKNSITAISKGRVTAIPITDITRVVRCQNGCMIYTADNCYPTRFSLLELLRDLPVNDFIRISRGFVVAVHLLKDYSNGFMTIGNSEVFITEKFRRSIIDQLSTILNQHYNFLERP